MVGGRKDDSVVINSSNVFAALGSLRKKKGKDGLKNKSSKNSGKAKGEEKVETQVFWAPAPLNAKSWADVDDEDDDDYYATTAPPRAVWDDRSKAKGKGSITPVEESESESEEEGLDEVDEEEEEHEHEDEAEAEAEPEHVAVVARNATELVVPKESERQLSKKELKKKELEELDAMLAEFGLKTEAEGGSQEKKTENLNGEVDNKENVTAGETKNAKKKKKKDKSMKNAKVHQEKPNGTEVGNGTKEEAISAEEAPAVDVKEKLKKMASAKRKKSSGKEMDTAAKAAASEAAARNAKLAASKKKEKTHYNQQPLR